MESVRLAGRLQTREYTPQSAGLAPGWDLGAEGQVAGGGPPAWAAASPQKKPSSRGISTWETSDQAKIRVRPQTFLAQG